MPLDRYGPWAVITGGSEGIGEAFARQLACAGINIVLVARSEAKLSRLARALHQEFDVEIRTIALDMSQEGALGAIQRSTKELEVGLLVCNVGAVFGAGRFLRSNLADIEKTMRLNNWSQVTLSHHFGRPMLERGRGGIVLIGSMAGNAGGASTVLYGAGKAFAQIFAEGLWSEVKSKGIDVLYVVVGAVNTPRRQSLNIVDSPGQIVADPADVAREALEALPEGPVHVPRHLQEDFAYFSGAPRREAAEAMTAMLKGFPRKKEASNRILPHKPTHPASRTRNGLSGGPTPMARFMGSLRIPSLFRTAAHSGTSEPDTKYHESPGRRLWNGIAGRMEHSVRPALRAMEGDLVELGGSNFKRPNTNIAPITPPRGRVSADDGLTEEQANELCRHSHGRAMRLRRRPHR